jgi:group I intron endonuclease
MLFQVSNEDKNAGGIYVIKNSINDKNYIGRAINFGIRYYTHLNVLKREKHSNVRLQYFVNKYGLDKLSFSILEIVPRPSSGDIKIYDQLLEQKEQIWFDKYDFKTLFNICRYAGSALGTIRTPQVREKLRLGKLGSKAPLAKLTESEVIAIYNLLIKGTNDSAIGNLYKVHRITINDIRHKRAWSQITNQMDEKFNIDPSTYQNSGKLFQSSQSKKREITEEFKQKISGSGNGRSLLKETEVLFILKNKGIIPRKKLSEMFKVNKSTVDHIHQRRIWKHLSISF